MARKSESLAFVESSSYSIRLIWIFVGIFATSNIYALTCTSATGARNWNVVATWSCGRVPTTADTVVIPNTSTVTLNANSAAVVSVDINAGGELVGDGTGKTLYISGAGTNDLVNNGTIDFSGAVGGGGSRAAVLRNSATQALDLTQTAGNASVWKFSTIHFNNRAATFANLTEIEFNGHATPFQNTNANITNNTTPNCNWIFSGSVAQTLSSANIQRLAGATTRVFSSTNAAATLTVRNTSATGLSVQRNMTGGSSLTSTLSVEAGATLTIDGTATTMVDAPTISLNSASTVRYARTNTQNIEPLTYGNLVITGGSTKTMLAGTHNILGDLTIEASTTYNGTSNNPVVNLAGNFINNGTAFNSGTGIYTFNGSVQQSLSGTTSFNRLTIANTAAGASRNLTIGNDVTVVTTLGFTSGRIVTGSNKIIIPNGASVTGAGSGTGWVSGNLQKFIPAGASTVNFEVGTNGASAPNLAYSPINASFVGVGGSGGALIAYSTVGDHPQAGTSGLELSKSVNRWWALTTTGVSGTALPAFTSYNAILNFISSDLDSGVVTSNLHSTMYIGGLWDAPATSARTSTSTQSNGITALGEFAVGEPRAVRLTKVSLTVSDPVNGTTNPKSIPGALKEYILAIDNPGLDLSTDSVMITDPINANTKVYVDDIAGSGSGPVAFAQGTPASGLNFTFAGLSSPADDVEFSNDGGSTWTYTPVIGADGCDSNVTNLRLNPKGVFDTGANISPNPNLQLRFRVCVK